jgi:ABC-type uncharacterized transport system substrate-binding protein
LTTSKSSLNVINRTSVTMICALLAVSLCAVASEEGHPGAPSQPGVLAVEWIPLHANKVIVEEVRAALAAPESGGAAITVTTALAYGDEKELDAIAKRINTEKPVAVLGLGDLVCEKLLNACPDVPVVAVSARKLALGGYAEKDNLVVIDSSPNPETVLDLAAELYIDLKGIGVLYTENYSPNAVFSAGLEKLAESRGIETVHIKVDPGFCRTDSDFEKAISGAFAGKPFQVLYAPNDPNSARFGATIFKETARLGIVGIGSEATIGKGCSAATIIDNSASATAAAGAILSITLGKAPTTPMVAVKCRIRR